jgi:hypothetical protein
MNPLTSLLLLANPVVTAVLTLVLFLESKKNKEMLQAVEKAVRDTQATIASVAVNLSKITEDQKQSVETFTGISDALKTSSTTNQQALTNVVTALTNASIKTEETMTTLAVRIEKTNKELAESIQANSNNLEEINSTLKNSVSI